MLVYNIICEALEDRDPTKIGGPYPKAYEMVSMFESLAEYYRVMGNVTWRTALLNLYQGNTEKELTLIENGGRDLLCTPPCTAKAATIPPWSRPTLPSAG